jgi:hypothetical protein
MNYITDMFHRENTNIERANSERPESSRPVIPTISPLCTENDTLESYPSIPTSCASKIGFSERFLGTNVFAGIHGLSYI